jgi:hypothetical protein
MLYEKKEVEQTSKLNISETTESCTIMQHNNQELFMYIEKWREHIKSSGEVIKV